jgi:biopolymer transport protein ExbB/TolQ
MFDHWFYFCLFDLLVLNLVIGWLVILQHIYAVISVIQNLRLMLSSKAYKWLNNKTQIQDFANDDA